MRTFAAVDLYGTTGAARRRRLVLAEFSVGTLVMSTLGGLSLSQSSAWLGWWLIGCGLNYAALTAHAVVLARPGRLDAAVAALDVRSELRRYSVAQTLLFIPGVVALAALVQVTCQIRPHKSPNHRGK